MIFIELVIRFMVGGILITGLTLLSKTKLPFLSGVLVLFPAVTLVGYYFIGQSTDSVKLQKIALFSIYTLPTTLIFLITFYFAITKYNLNFALMFSVIAWLSIALILVCLNNYFRIGA